MRSAAFIFLYHLLVLKIWSSPASAERYGPGGLDFAACQLSLQGPGYEDAPTAVLPGQKWCWSRLAVVSLYLCVDARCTDRDRIEGLGGVNKTCRSDELNSNLPPFNIIANYTDADISKIRHLRREDSVYTAVLGEVVVPSERLFRLSQDTLIATDYVRGYHYLYGLAMFIFWTGVVIIAMFNRLWVFASNIRRQGWPPVSGDTERGDDDSLPRDKDNKSGRVRIDRWLKQYVTTPATFGYRCAQNIRWCTIPPRIQSLAILVFVIINVVFCIHGYRVFPDNVYFPDVTYQWWRYVSDRTGVISFANFPIIWLFGMRNNVLMWFTGLDFGAYNNFHRWIARVATLQAVIHSVGYTVVVFLSGGWPGFLSWWTQMFWWAGELATVFMCLLLGFSVYWLRRGFYEVFLTLHIVLSLLVLVTMLGHVSIFVLEAYDDLAWACFYIWAFDRILRLSRIFSFNPAFWNTRAGVVYNPGSDIIRLTVPYAASAYQPMPGTFYYMHVVSGGGVKFWESHPFTVASITARPASHVEQGPRPTRRSGDGNGHDEPGSAEQSPLLNPAGGATPNLAGDKRPHLRKPPSTMTFLIRPYDGFTARLRDAAATAASVRVVVDGPYGHTWPLGDFDSILLVVGGSGIVVALSYLDAITASARVKCVRIVWAVRERSFAAEVVRDDIADAADGERVSLDIYITQTNDDGDNHNNNGREASLLTSPTELSSSERWPKGVRVLHGRPGVRDEVDDAAAGAGRGSLAVVACGPGRMADDARRAVVDATGRVSGPQIEYFEESFSW